LFLLKKQKNNFFHKKKQKTGGLLFFEKTWVFLNPGYIPSEAGFSHIAKIKEAISPLFLINVPFLLNNTHVLTLFYFGPRVNVRLS